MITLQAVIMAYANDFMLLTLICVLSIPFVFAIGSTASLRGGRGRCASRARDGVGCSIRRARSAEPGIITRPRFEICGYGSRARARALRMTATELLPHLLGMLAERRIRP